VTRTDQGSGTPSAPHQPAATSPQRTIKENTTMSAADATEFDADYDVVVIGSGASGLSAAVEAAGKGLRVAVLEKMEHIGGSSAFAEGHAAFESEEQVSRGIEVTKDQGFNTLMDYSHWRADPSIVSRFVDNAATTIKKLKDLGIVYQEVIVTAPDQPGELVTWHIPEGEVAHVLDVLEAEARRRGADVFLQTPAKRLLTRDGRIEGVEAQDADGQSVRLGARAVVVGTGGYAANPKMFNTYARNPVGEHLINIGNPGNTGDGLAMMFEAGAVPFESIGTALLNPFVRGKTPTSNTAVAGFQPYLWVDRDGRRFVNEICGLDFGNAGDVVAGLPGAYYWSIIDASQVEHLVADGNEVGLGIYVRNYEKLTNLPTELAADVDGDFPVFRADTIADLASAIGVDPQVLTAEVDEYNRYCRDGRDPRFHKDPAYLRPLIRAPYHAIKMEPAIMITMGGIKIDDRMRCVDAAGEAIPGLYSVGCDAGGLFGESYSLPVPGTANGFALTSGWLAADDIAERIARSAL
jgi:fumarate reductase flavoprotein subunit